jgi:hypothetical protein
MSDEFSDHESGLNSPFTRHYTITPDDDADLPTRPRAVYCNGDGDAVLRDEGGVDVTYALTVGQRIEGRIVRVLATGTTATLVAWY